MREDDVGGEERGVGKREADRERLPAELHVRQQVHAARSGRDGRDVAGRAPISSEHDRSDELDRGDGRHGRRSIET